MAYIKPKNKKFYSGQSLMETIVAIAILSTVALAILTLVTDNIIGQKESESQIIANNLAREGIEAARNIRDSNSLAGVNWDEGLVGQAAIAAFDPANNSWELKFGEAPAAWQLYFTNNVYRHDNTGQPSPFSRHLTFKDICLDDDGAESIKDSCESGERKIGFKISSVVGWTEHGRNRQVSLEELLYAWK